MAKSNKSKAESETPEIETPAPVVNVEAPAAIVKALSKLAKASEGERLSYLDTAKAVRAFGKAQTGESGLKPEEIRLALGKSIAEGFGVGLEVVTTSPKKFADVVAKDDSKTEAEKAKLVSQNGTLYALRSTLSGIAMPSTPERENAVDVAIDDENSRWQDIVKASRIGSGRAPSGEGKPEKDPKPFDLERFAQEIGNLIGKCYISSIDPEHAFKIGVASLIESIKSDYKEAVAAVNFTVTGV